jgi:hypothetical protein
VSQPEPAPPRWPRWSWTFKLSLTFTISFALLLAVGLPLLHRGPDAVRQFPTEGVGMSVATQPPGSGAIDIHVWRTGPDGAAVRIRLTDPAALPLKPGDQFRIEATADRPAYLYLFWVDTEGQAAPVYPWQPGKWGTRPPEERPTPAVDLPPAAAKGYTISGDLAGMETLILVARADRLALPDEQIQMWFAGLPAQRPYQDARSAVWFENGRIVTADARRTRSHFDEADIADPVLRLQGLLKDRIGPHAAATAAVSFARLGKGGQP